MKIQRDSTPGYRDRKITIFHDCLGLAISKGFAHPEMIRSREKLMGCPARDLRNPSRESSRASTLSQMAIPFSLDVDERPVNQPGIPAKARQRVIREKVPDQGKEQVARSQAQVRLPGFRTSDPVPMMGAEADENRQRIENLAPDLRQEGSPQFHDRSESGERRQEENRLAAVAGGHPRENAGMRAETRISNRKGRPRHSLENEGAHGNGPPLQQRGSVHKTKESKRP